jgi:hypothetical protein
MTPYSDKTNCNVNYTLMILSSKKHQIMNRPKIGIGAKGHELLT